MKAYGIDQETWDQILSVLRSESKVREIILFGSRAKGVFKEGSDIDICIKGKDLGYDYQIRLNGLLDELDHPWEIGQLIQDMIDEPMLNEHIARVGISFDSGMGWLLKNRPRAESLSNSLAGSIDKMPYKSHR